MTFANGSDSVTVPSSPRKKKEKKNKEHQK